MFNALSYMAYVWLIHGLDIILYGLYHISYGYWMSRATKYQVGVASLLLLALAERRELLANINTTTTTTNNNNNDN